MLRCRHSEHPISIRWRLMEDRWMEGWETNNQYRRKVAYREAVTDCH
ncbi:MAG: hypothetical protein J5937_00845 [Paludibacteraceae bacterium]|nr:hypothetical protein [Paludibacteraceae bacterium]